MKMTKTEFENKGRINWEIVRTFITIMERDGKSFAPHHKIDCVWTRCNDCDADSSITVDGITFEYLYSEDDDQDNINAIYQLVGYTTLR